MRQVARRVAIGDPQASLERFFAVLEHHDLLGDDGWLAPDVYLLSMGDHFDWGGAEERALAARDGLCLLSWLAAHSEAQVGLILGNHDLGRVGELAAFDDASFAPAHRQAVAAYRGGDVDARAEAALLERYPCVPTAELLARDFAAFIEPQRELVAALLSAGRLRVALALSPQVLACHAGVTVAQLAALGLPPEVRDARSIADALQRALSGAWAARDGSGPLVIPLLHRPGDRERGEGGGMFYHRPCNPVVMADPSALAGTYTRRYDARTLPLGITQIVGHIGDGKCRALLGSWAADVPTPAGALRHLRTDGDQVYYGPGTPSVDGADEACVIFTDGRMARTPPADYQLLDLASLQPLARPH